MTINYYRPRIWLASALLLALIGLTGKAQALSTVGSSITTSPVSISLSTTPGNKISTTLQLQNNAQTAVSVDIKLYEFKADGLTGKAQIYNPPSTDPQLSWVQFSKPSFVAQPGVWNSITMTISPPSTASLGYYYSVLFVPKVINQTLNTPTNTIKGANAILVLLDVHTKNQKTDLSVENFSAAKSVNQYLPVNFNVTVHNGGNIYTAPRGDIYISRTYNGQTIDTLDINDAAGNVLPGTDRVFSTSWTNGFPVFQDKRINGQILSNKNGVPIQQLNWDLKNASNFRFGKYYAHLVLVYNNGSRDIAINGEVSFWVIPWFILLIFTVLALLILAGVFSISRLIYKRIKKNK